MTLKGRVINVAMQLPVPGTEVVNLTTGEGTLTDERGIFTIKADDEDILQFNHPDMENFSTPAHRVQENVSMVPTDMDFNDPQVQQAATLPKKAASWILTVLGIGAAFAMVKPSEAKKEIQKKKQKTALTGPVKVTIN